MKRIILFAIAAFAACYTYAQEPADALRLSWTVPSGTARQQAIGGAMGSLGGDITALFVNPAGLGFYKTGDAVITPSYKWSTTKGTFLDRTEKSTDGKFDMGATGFVLAGPANKRNNSIAFSLGFNTTANYRSDVLYRGINHQSSYSQKFLEEVGTIKDPNIVSGSYPFGSSLAFNTYWIDTVSGGSSGNYQFQSRSLGLLSTGLIQEKQVSHRGGIYEGSLGLAVNKNDKFFFGGALGLPFMYYSRDSRFTEADATTDTSNKFDYAEFRENLTTKGMGINLKFGVIYKPQEYWRLGLAFHSPTLFSLTDTYEYQVTTNTENYKGTLTDYSTNYNDQHKANQFKYLFVTPYKLIGSISYVLRETQDVRRQKGFITADVEYVNYKVSSYMTDNSATDQPNNQQNKDYLKSLNKTIDNVATGAFNFRVGGELKFTTLMFRAGAAYYGNPYKPSFGGKGDRLDLSGGLGYRNKGFFIDLTYVHSSKTDVDAPYRLQNSSYPIATTKAVTGNILLTVGSKF